MYFDPWKLREISCDQAWEYWMFPRVIPAAHLIGYIDSDDWYGFYEEYGPMVDNEPETPRRGSLTENVEGAMATADRNGQRSETPVMNSPFASAQAGTEDFQGSQAWLRAPNLPRNSGGSLYEKEAPTTGANESDVISNFLLGVSISV